MVQGRWERIETLFAQASELSATERGAFLDQACVNDLPLRAELETLLHAHDSAAGFLEAPPQLAGEVISEAAPLPVDARLGAWRVVRLVGRGGMGEVYEVERANGGFRQKAALKLLKREAAGQIERFHAERNILARLHHPGIAQLLDGGVAADGRPWAVLEYVEGQTITDHCRTRRLALEARLALFLQVCDAAAYAHRNLIVHRDLKPSNILVDKDGRVRLLDFGIAKLLDPGTWSGGAVTSLTQIPLTPDYCAPEQLTGEAITTTTDVYALGLLLYELLTSSRPWSMHGQPLARVLRTLMEIPAPVPSAKAATHADTPFPARILRGDLDAIVARCLRKEPSHRYATVDALQLDVERSRSGQPIIARGGVRLYLFGCFLRRWRWAVGAAAALVITLVAALIIVAWQQRLTAIEARKAGAVKNLLVGIFRQNAIDNPDGTKARSTTAEQLLELGSRRIRANLQDLPETRAELLGTVGSLYAQLNLSEPAVSLLGEQVETLRRLRGYAPSRDVADAQVQLGEAQLVAGRYQEAQQTLTASLQVLDALHDQDSIGRAHALGGLAQIAFKTRPTNDPTAVNYQMQVLAILETKHPDDDYRIAALIVMARIYARRDENAAEQRFREALQLEQRPGFHSLPADVASIRAEYGELLRRARRYPEAERELRESIALFLRQVGPDFAPVLRSQQQLALVFFEQGRPEEAQPLLEQVLQALERVRGPDDLQWTADARISLARVLLARGELEAAQQQLERSLYNLRRQAPDSAYLPISRRVQAELFVAQGRWTEAEEALADARSGIEHFYGEKHERYAGVLLTEAELRLAQQDTVHAEALYKRILEVWPAAAEPTPDSYYYASLGLARLRLLQGQASDAATLARRVLEQLLALPQAGSMRAQEAAARLWLGEALWQSARSGEAFEHLQRAVQMREALDHADSPWLAQARLALAECLRAHREPTRAGRLRALASAALARHAALGPQFRLPQQQLHRTAYSAKAAAF
jgi:serine/threonine-protein kinase